MREVSENILRLVCVLLLQVLLINNLQFMGVCNPCIYLLFLIALPTNLPQPIETLIGFSLGLVMDLFCNTLGAHMMACSAFSFLRPLILQQLVQQKERLIGSLHIDALGWSTYIKLLVTLVLTHHTILFAMEAFSFSLIGIVLLQVIVSSLITIALILGWEAIHL